MENRFFLLMILGQFWSGLLFSQEATERKIAISLGVQNAFCLDISGADRKMVESALAEFCQSFTKPKYNKKAKEWQLNQVRIPGIQNKEPWDVFVIIQEQTKSSVTTSFVFDLGSSFLIEKEKPELSKAVRQWLRDYYFAVSRKIVLEEVINEEKKLTALKRDLNKLQDKNNHLQKEIEKAKLKIAENEKAIELNLTDQENKQRQVEAQQLSVRAATDKLNSIGKNN